METLKYVKSIDKRLKTIEGGHVQKPITIFENILPIDSKEDLEKLEEKIETPKKREDFVS